MGLEVFSKIIEGFVNVFNGIQGIGSIFVITGLTILIIIGVGMGLHYFIKLIKQLPNLTVREFIKYTVLFATILIIVGIILP